MYNLCIFSCKDKAMVGYNVLEMYLRTIGFFLLALKRHVEKNHIRLSTFQRRGGGVGSRKVRPLSTFFLKLFLTLPLYIYTTSNIPKKFTFAND